MDLLYNYNLDINIVNISEVQPVKVDFSNHISSKKSLIMRFINELSTDFKYVSVLATDVSGTSYQTDFSTSSISDSGVCERGYVARIYNSINYSEFSFNDFSEDNYLEIVKEARNLVMKDFQSLKDAGVEPMEFPVIDEENIQQQSFGEIEKLPTTIPAETKIERLVNIVNKAKEYSDQLVNLRAAYEEVNVSKGFYSINKCLEQSYFFTTVFVLAVVQKNGIIKYDFDASSGKKGWEIMDDADQMYKIVIDNAVELLDADTVVPGEYDVICDPSVAGLIAHEAFGHGVEMDMFVKNRAKGAEYIDKYVASKKTRMHDGATSAENVASYLFDDEGTLGTDTLVIEDGILKSGISDLLSAIKLGTTPTGNGRRESFERKAYARMTNTFFAPGNDSLEDMIASIDSGYLLENYNSGMEDPKNWGIQCIVSKGREIKNGKLTGKIVAPIMLTGYVPDILSSISMVSDTELKLSGSGFCGKGYKEWVKTSIGGTYLKAKARLG